MNDNNQPKNTINSLSLRNSQYILKDGYYDFLCKKAEKLASAIYVITGHIKDSDPIKVAQRELAIELIFTVSSLNGSFSHESLRNLKISVSEITSLLFVAFNSGSISEANHLILRKEFNDLLDEAYRLSTNNVSVEDAPLPAGFFDVPKRQIETRAITETKQGIVKDKKVQSQEPYKGQKNYVEISQKGNINLIKDKDLKLSPNDKKLKRRETITGILHKNQGIDIKGFSKEMPDCSEKTVQRELIEMLEEGLIRKEGERRWSRYYLK